MENIGELIPIAGIIAGVLFAYIGLKYRQLTLTHRQSEGERQAEAVEKKRLEGRLAVLERIVTDRGIQTAEQIEALRTADAEDLRSLQGN